MIFDVGTFSQFHLESPRRKILKKKFGGNFQKTLVKTSSYGYNNMEALYAGLSAWGIELSIAALAFYLLYREEQKVYKRRAAKKEEV